MHLKSNRWMTAAVLLVLCSACNLWESREELVAECGEPRDSALWMSCCMDGPPRFQWSSSYTDRRSHYCLGVLLREGVLDASRVD